MRNLPFLFVCFLSVASQAAAQETLPLRYKGLPASPGFRLVKVLGTPEMQPAGGNTFAQTGDGKFTLFASGNLAIFQEQTEDSSLSLWDVAKGTVLSDIPLGKESVTALALSTDARQAITSLGKIDDKGQDSHRLVLWDLEAGKELRTLVKPKTMLSTLVLSPDGKRALGGSQDGKVIIWDIANPGQPTEFQDQQNQPILAAAFTKDGKQAFVASGQNVRLWDVGTTKSVRTYAGNQAQVMRLVLSDDGKRLAGSGLYDSTVYVWDVATGKSVAEIKKDPANALLISLAFTPEGDKLVLAATGFDAITGMREESSVSLVDVTTKKELWTRKASFKGLVPIAVGSQIVVGGGANSWTAYDLDKGTRLRDWGGHKSALTALAHGSKHLLSSSQDGQGKSWDGATPSTFIDPGQGATALAVDGPTVLVATLDKALLLWNDLKREGAPPKRIATGHTDNITCVALVPESKRAVSAGRDRVLKYWDLETGKELRSFTGHAETINGVAVSPDGQWAATASDDNTVRLWNLDKKDVDPIVLEGHKRQVTCVEFSPDGRFLASGSQDQTVKLWDITRSKLVRTFEGHKNWIGAVAFRGNDRIVSASDDLTVRQWDVSSAKETAKLDLGNAADCPKCLALHDDHLYVGTAGWVILKFEMTAAKKDR